MASSPLDRIKAPVATELDGFESAFRDLMRSKVPLLDWVTRYIVRRKGKQIRPMLVYLAARCYGECGEKSRRAAALVELLHTATLVHDDVVDGAPKRRGFWSINALWKNKIAVLIGDYLLSRGLLLALDHKDYQVLHLTSNAVRRMAERQRGVPDGVNGSIGRCSPLRNPKVRARYQNIAHTQSRRWRNSPITSCSHRALG